MPAATDRGSPPVTGQPEPGEEQNILGSNLKTDPDRWR